MQAGFLVLDLEMLTTVPDSPGKLTVLQVLIMEWCVKWTRPARRASPFLRPGRDSTLRMRQCSSKSGSEASSHDGGMRTSPM